MYAKIKKLLQETAESDDIAKISDPATPKNEREDIYMRNRNNDNVLAAHYSNPILSPESLDTASRVHTKSKNIMRSIAKNPNNTLEGILTAINHLPGEEHVALENPMFPLHLLENPDAINNLKTSGAKQGLIKLAGNPNVTHPIQQIFGTNPFPSLAEGLATNPNLDPDVARNLFAKEDSMTKSRDEQTDADYSLYKPIYNNLGSNPSIPDDLHQKYIDRLQGKDPENFHPFYAHSVLANPKTDPTIVENYFDNMFKNNKTIPEQYETDTIVTKTFEHPDLTPKTLHYLSRMGLPDNESYEKLISHKNISPETLDYLHTWHDENYYINNLISKQPKTQTHTLDKLIEQPQQIETLQNLASHPNTSQKGLHKLTRNYYRVPEVKNALMNNPNLHPKSKEYLEKNDPSQNIMHGGPIEPLPESRLDKILKNLKENEITTIKSTFLGKPAKKPASPTSPTPHNIPSSKPKKNKNLNIF